jgi:hypothetical protein
MNTFDDLPIEWQQKVQGLRAECASHRIQRNKARAEAESLRAELAALRAEIGR